MFTSVSNARLSLSAVTANEYGTKSTPRGGTRLLFTAADVFDSDDDPDCPQKYSPCEFIRRALTLTLRLREKAAAPLYSSVDLPCSVKSEALAPL